MYKKKLKKAAALLLAGTMAFSLTACGGGGDDNKPTQTPTSTPAGGDDQTPTPTPTPTPEDTGSGGEAGQVGVSTKDENGIATLNVAPSETKRKIRIGTWYDHFYESKHTKIEDDPNMNDPETAQMRLDNLRRIEEKYNVEIEYVNLTWEGTIESINTSIMAGSPECDIYEVDLQFGVPAALNGYAAALEDFVDPANDVFNDQTVMKYLNIGGMEKSFLFTPNALDTGASPLAFNMHLIDEANLENPQDLYDRGEWTWDKFREYLRVLTKDDVYGFTGWHTVLLDNLLMSNGAHIAGGKTEGLSSPATIEALDFMYQIYQVDKTARPWNDDNWDINVSSYAEGKVGFWNTATWIQSQYGLSDTCGFEIGVVPWPVGPSGNQETNSQIKVAGNYYMIPVGVERPELVYQVMFEYANWFNGDLDYRDDTEWAENQMETERNFDYLVEMGKSQPWFDIWQSVGINAGYAMVTSQADAVLTAAQAAEQEKQVVQDYLDIYMK